MCVPGARDRPRYGPSHPAGLETDGAGLGQVLLGLLLVVAGREDLPGRLRLGVTRRHRVLVGHVLVADRAGSRAVVLRRLLVGPGIAPVLLRGVLAGPGPFLQRLGLLDQPG